MPKRIPLVAGLAAIAVAFFSGAVSAQEAPKQTACATFALTQHRPARDKVSGEWAWVHHYGQQQRTEVDGTDLPAGWAPVGGGGTADSAFVVACTTR